MLRPRREEERERDRHTDTHTEEASIGRLQQLAVFVPLFFLSLDLLADVVDSALQLLPSLFRRKVAAVCRSQALKPILKYIKNISKYDLIINKSLFTV